MAGKLDEDELLRRTEYFTRWGYDFRLYAPILRFARENGIPLVALNLPAEVTRKVGEGGLESLSEDESQWVPAEIDRSDEGYRRRLQRIYEEHPDGRAEDFERFFQVQLLWDEGMAERAARYLRANPNRFMVILAGDGHLAHGSGIPDRLSRRIPVSRAIVLNGWWGPLRPDLADYLLFSDGQRLPPAGMLGLLLAEADEGLEVEGFSEDSAARAAGLSRGDLVLALNGHPVATMADVKTLMWDRRPGERIEVRYRPGKWLMFQGEPRTVDVELR
ncbi:MAG: PDZ domain-containing protein [Gammaproteobacteria bacterium]|nr:PDZ domain-containing protein [Gammaproteobacteria bacterium]NIR96799.1 PDZ domain-containing protein [Gammaproteobacteria bacterium]NIT62499.1 PDZ domain-containing protein [Gammaproteobacteria bacterium]NIV19439.1 PDZ domain-containing protein [Gammaproteobacteria bacterium]NIX10522.1 PDZ domain-containing protein [Gammaproteobacteria bacterium]